AGRARRAAGGACEPLTRGATAAACADDDGDRGCERGDERWCRRSSPGRERRTRAVHRLPGGQLRRAHRRTVRTQRRSAPVWLSLPMKLEAKCLAVGAPEGTSQRYGQPLSSVTKAKCSSPLWSIQLWPRKTYQKLAGEGSPCSKLR